MGQKAPTHETKDAAAMGSHDYLDPPLDAVVLGALDLLLREGREQPLPDVAGLAAPGGRAAGRGCSALPWLALFQLVRGRAALGESRFADAYQELRRIFDPADSAHHCGIGAWALADLADSAVHGNGDLAEVRRYVEQVDLAADEDHLGFLGAQRDYARAVLAPAEQAEPLFRVTLANSHESCPVLGARALLAYGMWLRRQRRMRDSRQPLRAAWEAFTALGEHLQAERAWLELRASSDRPRRRTPGASADLTPREHQIAQLAANGLTNREIGLRLYVSRRTVGFHLHQIFTKLAIGSRSQLHAAIAQLTEGGQEDQIWPV